MTVKFYNGTMETESPQIRSITKIMTGGGSSEESVQYYGSTKELLGLDNLNTYGWDHYIEDNSELDPLKLLPKNIRESVIGDNVTEIESFRDSLIITKSSTTNENGKDNISYFGSISAKRQKLIMFVCPKNSTWAELYEGDAKKIRISFEEESDIKAIKLVWILFTFGDKDLVSDVNLSFRVWETTDRLGRNVDKYLARISDTIKEYDTVTNPFSEYWVDNGSGFILGNKLIKEEDTPLFNQIKKSVETNQKWNSDTLYSKNQVVTFGTHESYWFENKQYDLPFTIPVWSETRKFTKGNLCRFKGDYYLALTVSTNVKPDESIGIWKKLEQSDTTDDGSLSIIPTEYISLVDYNRNNHPILSSYWAKKSYINSLMKERGRVILNAYKSDGVHESSEFPGIAENGLYTIPTSQLTTNVLVSNGFIFKGYTEEENYNLYRKQGKVLTYTVDNPGSAVVMDFLEFECPVVDNGSVELGKKKAIRIPKKDNTVGVEKVLLKRVAGSITEIVEENNYDIDEEGNVLVDLYADFPCTYEYLVDWISLHHTVTLTNYIGFYVDKSIGKVYPPSQNNVSFTLAPIDRSVHTIKITSDDGTELILEMIGNKTTEWFSHASKNFLTGRGRIDFGIKGSAWSGYYTLEITDTDMDRNIKVEII